MQTIGRAARNAEGHVIMYADNMTDSMRLAIDETKRRRAIQEAYNKEHGITPKTIKKAVRDAISISKEVEEVPKKQEKDPESMSRKELEAALKDVQKRMKQAAAELNFEEAVVLRDSDHLFRPDFQMQLLCQITAEISHCKAVPVYTGHAVLDILLRFLKPRLFFYFF